jgi:hypothetical protein
VTERELTYRQRMFTEHYLGDAAGNGVQAARLAGYSGNARTLHSTAYELLRNPAILARIRARVEEVTGDTTAILEHLWHIASAPTEHFMIVTREEEYDQDGNLLRGAQMRLDYGAKVRALELLMRFHGMLANKPPAEVTVKALVGVDINRI